MAFSLEETLNSAARPCRKNELWTFISTLAPIPRANNHADYDGDAHIASHHAGGSGHREDCRHNKQKRSAVLKLMTQGGVSHSECLKFLCRNGPTFLTRSLKNKNKKCSVLLKIADNVKRADHAPADSAEQPEWDMLDMRLWYVSLCKLIKEMKTVQERTLSVIDNAGVYVITSSPYGAFLRALAAEVADRSG